MPDDYVSECPLAVRGDKPLLPHSVSVSGISYFPVLEVLKVEGVTTGVVGSMSFSVTNQKLNDSFRILHIEYQSIPFPLFLVPR